VFLNFFNQTLVQTSLYDTFDVKVKIDAPKSTFEDNSYGPEALGSWYYSASRLKIAGCNLMMYKLIQNDSVMISRPRSHDSSALGVHFTKVLVSEPKSQSLDQSANVLFNIMFFALIRHRFLC